MFNRFYSHKSVTTIPQDLIVSPCFLFRSLYLEITSIRDKSTGGQEGFEPSTSSMPWIKSRENNRLSPMLSPKTNIQLTTLTASFFSNLYSICTRSIRKDDPQPRIVWKKVIIRFGCILLIYPYADCF